MSLICPDCNNYRNGWLICDNNVYQYNCDMEVMMPNVSKYNLFTIYVCDNGTWHEPHSYDAFNCSNCINFILNLTAQFCAECINIPRWYYKPGLGIICYCDENGTKVLYHDNDVINCCTCNTAAARIRLGI